MRKIYELPQNLKLFKNEVVSSMLTVKLEIIDFRAPGSQAHALYGTK